MNAPRPGFGCLDGYGCPWYGASKNTRLLFRRRMKMPDTVTIPVAVLKKLEAAARAAEEAQDALEDYLLSENPRFLDRMRAARASHRSRRTKPLAFIRKP
jgi:hypothetical protein